MLRRQADESARIVRVRGILRNISCSKDSGCAIVRLVHTTAALQARS